MELTVSMSENAIFLKEEFSQRLALIDQIKANNLKFDPQTDYVYSHYYGKSFSLHELQQIVNRTSAFGEPISPEEVIDITPSYEERLKAYSDGNGWFDLERYEAFINEKVSEGAYFYGREKQCFFEWEAAVIAARMGRKWVILENYS